MLNLRLRTLAIRIRRLPRHGVAGLPLLVLEAVDLVRKCLRRPLLCGAAAHARGRSLVGSAELAWAEASAEMRRLSLTAGVLRSLWLGRLRSIKPTKPVAGSRGFGRWLALFNRRSSAETRQARLSSTWLARRLAGSLVELVQVAAAATTRRGKAAAVGKLAWAVIVVVVASAGTARRRSAIRVARPRRRAAWGRLGETPLAEWRSPKAAP